MKQNKLYLLLEIYLVVNNHSHATDPYFFKTEVCLLDFWMTTALTRTTNIHKTQHWPMYIPQDHGQYPWLWSMLTINLPVSYLCSRGSYSRWGCARTKPRHIPVKTWLPLTIGPHRAVINDNTADRPCQTLSTQAFTRAMVHLVGFIFVFVSRTMSEAQRQ